MSDRVRVCGVVLAALMTALAACTSGGDAPAAPAGPSAVPTSAASSSATSAAPVASSTASPTASASTPAVSACVRSALDDLDLTGRVGQLLMIGVPVGTAQDGASAVRKYELGGVFLAGRSQAGVSTVTSRVAALRRAATGPGLLVSVDQEGGSVQTLSGSGFGSIPSALRQGRLDGDELASDVRTWSAALARAGIDMNLAPVADTVTAARADRNPPIGAFSREYGHTSTAVSQALDVVVPAMLRAGVQPTLKHFPGLGRVRYNTDTSSRAVDLVATKDDVYLKPFAAGIAAGAGAVMISSARYPRLDPDAVAAFSKPIVTGLLRGRLGWTGVVISDDLGRAKAVASVPLGQRAVRFVAAGGDIVLAVRTSDAGPLRSALLARAKASSSFRAQVDAAATRVLSLKERAGLLDC